MGVLLRFDADYRTRTEAVTGVAHMIEITDKAYQFLVDTAHDRGKTPQQLLEEWLLDLQAAEGGIPAEYDPTKDPLAPFLGAFEADAPDVVARHDDYLAETYADAHTLGH
jgi:hypothetical protein